MTVDDILKCQVGTLIKEDVFLENIFLYTGKSGIRWYNAILSDKSGRITGKLWREVDNEEVFSTVSSLVGNVVTVSGMVGSYNGRPELHINNLTLVEGADVNLYIKTLTSEQRERLCERLDGFISSIEDEKIRFLLEKVFDEGRLRMLAERPAGYSHHCFNGGLLVWALEVAEIATSMAELTNKYLSFKDYPRKELVDIDLVVASSLLSGLGKLNEFSPLPLKDVKPRGKLVGYPQEAFACFALFNNMLPREHRLTSTAVISNIILSASADSTVQPMTKEAEIVRNATKLVEDCDSYDVQLARYDERNPGNTDSFVFSSYLKHDIYRR